MQKIKEAFFSEKCMNIVNALFFLSAVFYRSGLIFLAQLAWIVYLSFCIKHTESKGSKIIYFILIGVAAALVCVNLYGLLRG